RVTVARAGLAGVHVTSAVISRVVPLLNVPVAVMLWVTPWTSVTLAGLRVMPVRVPPVTLRLEVPVTPLGAAALIVVVPCASVCTAPPVGEIVAMAGWDELQVT